MVSIALIFLLFVYLERAQSSKVTHEITWNPQFSESFQFGNVHSVHVHMKEYMDIICPQYDADATSTLQFVISQVEKEAFESCQLPKDAKNIYACDSPSNPKKLTLKFQDYSPNPLAFIFNPGHTYYYMALVHNGGEVEHECSNAMRLVVYVHPEKPPRHHDHIQHGSSQLPNNDGGPPHHSTTASPPTPTTTSTSKPTTSRFKSTKSILIARITTAESIGTPEPRGDPNYSSQLRCSLWWIVLSTLVVSLINR